MKTNVIGWVARVLSVLGVGIILMFMIGEGFNPAYMTVQEKWLVLGFPIGVCIGMIVGWFREGLGGVITALSLALFFIVHYAQWGRSSRRVGVPHLLVGRIALPRLVALHALATAILVLQHRAGAGAGGHLRVARQPAGLEPRLGRLPRLLPAREFVGRQLRLRVSARGCRW